MNGCNLEMNYIKLRHRTCRQYKPQCNLQLLLELDTFKNYSTKEVISF